MDRGEAEPGSFSIISYEYYVSAESTDIGIIPNKTGSNSKRQQTETEARADVDRSSGGPEDLVSETPQRHQLGSGLRQ